MYRNTVANKMAGTKPTDKKIKAAAPRTADSGHESDELPLAQRPRGQPLEPFASSGDEGESVGEEEALEDEGEGEEGEDEGEEDEGEEGEGADEEEMEGEEEEQEKQKQRPAKKRARKGGKQVPDEFSKIILAQYKHHAPNADKPFSVLGKYEYTIPGCVPGEYPKLGSNSVEARWNVPMRAIIGLVWKEFTKANPAYLALLSYWMLLAAFKKSYDWVRRPTTPKQLARVPRTARKTEEIQKADGGWESKFGCRLLEAKAAAVAAGTPYSNDDVVPCDMATQSKTEAIVEKLKWDKYFAYFNDHFEGIQEPSPPEGLKPFASLWGVYKRGVLRSTAFSPVLRRAPAARVQLNLAPSIPLSPTPAAGGQHQHHPPVQHRRQTRRGQWPQVGTSPRATGSAAGGQQHQQQQQDQRQVTEEEQQQPGGEGAGPSSSKRPRPAEDQALIQSLIQKVDTVQDTVNRLEASTGGTLLHGGAVRFPKNTQGMVYQLPTLLPYTGKVYQPHELEQCRQAALALGLTIFQLPQLAIDMAAVVAASILITRVYNHMVFSSVNANSKTQYGTGQRVQVVLAKSDKNSRGDLDTTLTLLTDTYNAAVYNALTEEKKKQVDEAKEVLAQYLTLLQPVLRQLLGRPLNALATIITDPTWQRRLNRNGNMVTTPAQQLAQAQAPHTDFLPVGPGMDDGLVFLLALQDFPLVAYMGSHKLSRLAAAHCRRTADGQKQVVEVKDMDALAMTLPHQLGTEVLVKAGQLVLFRGNTVHAGNVGVAGSCCARLYGFGRPDTVADNTTMNTSELGDLYHGLFQPIQDEGIGPKMADWNRRGMAGQTQWCQDHVVRDQDPVEPGPCGEEQNPVVPGPCGERPGPCRTLWLCSRTLWCQNPVVWCQNPVVRCQDPVGKDPVDPVMWYQDPVSQDPVGVQQDPVDPVVRCQDPVGQNPVVRCQDPVGVQQDPVVWYQDPVVPEPCEALPTVGKEYQQRYKLVNDRLPKVRQRLHRAAEYRRGIDGRARNNA
ncbi:hypothetical protein QJQ45_011586 [Haematococcus lacustris]|nr:hypothetical protein QJQ45_011586 [Haematococcus lacustris]